MATCVVSGTMKDASETAVASATVRANILTPFFVSTVQIVPKELSTTTDTNGAWSLTLSRSQSYKVTIEYPPNTTDTARRYDYAITTPAAATANFSDLASES